MVCSICDRPIRSNQHMVECCRCCSWIHKGCSGLSNPEFEKIYNQNKKTGSHGWACKTCSVGVVKRVSIGTFGNTKEDSAPGSSSTKRHANTKKQQSSGQTTLTELQLRDRVSYMMAEGSLDGKSIMQLLSQVVDLLLDQKNNVHDIHSILTSVKDSCFTKMGKLETEICELRSKITDLESNVQKSQQSSSGSSYSQDDIMNESVERQLRAKNMIVFNVIESQSAVAGERIDHDKTKFISVLDTLGVGTNVAFRVNRIGRNNNAQPRPMRVQFEEMSIVAECLKNRYKLRDHSINIRPDLTLLQRKRIKKTYEELKNRQEIGETNLTLKFRNGIPFIVTKDPRRSSEVQSGNGGVNP